MTLQIHVANSDDRQPVVRLGKPNGEAWMELRSFAQPIVVGADGV